MRRNRMSKRMCGSDAIVVLTADPFAFDGSDRFEIGDNALHSAFGNAHQPRHLAKHDEGISRQEHQDVRVICQECPMAVESCGPRSSGAASF